MLRRLRTILSLRTTAYLEFATTSSPNLLLLLPHLPFQFPKTNSTASASPSLTLHFLQNSCGLPPDAAAATAEKLHLKTTKNGHAVLALLREYGFSRVQIAALVFRRPALLVASPVRTIKPKLDFYRDEVGLSEAELVNRLCSNGKLLTLSVENRLAPNLALLRSTVRDRERLSAIIRKWTALLTSNLTGMLLPRVEALRGYGVTDAVISTLLKDHRKVFKLPLPHFVNILERAKRTPLRPDTTVFAHALGVFALLPERNWRIKVTNFERMGWSEEQVLRAFARYPFCMSASVDKVRTNMEFFANELGWRPEYVSMHPVVLSLSFDKRILRRCLVMAILASKGLFDGKVKAVHLMKGELDFMNKYVIKYQDQLPELSRIMEGKMEHQDYETKYLHHIKPVNPV